MDLTEKALVLAAAISVITAAVSIANVASSKSKPKKKKALEIPPPPPPPPQPNPQDQSPASSPASKSERRRRGVNNCLFEAVIRALRMRGDPLAATLDPEDLRDQANEMSKNNQLFDDSDAPMEVLYTSGEQSGEHHIIALSKIVNRIIVAHPRGANEPKDLRLNKHPKVPNDADVIDIYHEDLGRGMGHWTAKDQSTTREMVRGTPELSRQLPPT